jgi:hypothetical protein
MRGFGRWLGASVALMLSVHALGSLAYASITTPEIDPSSIPAGLALITGGVLMMRARRRSK